jgi:putative glutamine amidotransferase
MEIWAATFTPGARQNPNQENRRAEARAVRRQDLDSIYGSQAIPKPSRLYYTQPRLREPEMSRPLIGITLHPDDDPDRANLDILLRLIVEGVERAGGLPALVPSGLPDETLRALYARLDGVLLSGGGDVDAAHYGAEPHPTMGGVDAGRDRTEMALARWVAEDGKPLFGICRGAQVLNVALGGTLYRDISEHVSAMRHTYDAVAEGALRPHEIRIEADTLLARIIGLPMLAVNSLHHQALREVAPGLVSAARAPDGIVEAVELPGLPFALAVQWHPECLPDAPEQRRLFEAFVEAAGRRPPSYG